MIVSSSRRLANTLEGRVAFLIKPSTPVSSFHLKFECSKVCHIFLLSTCHRTRVVYKHLETILVTSHVPLNTNIEPNRPDLMSPYESKMRKKRSFKRDPVGETQQIKHFLPYTVKIGSILTDLCLSQICTIDITLVIVTNYHNNYTNFSATPFLFLSMFSFQCQISMIGNKFPQMCLFRCCFNGCENEFLPVFFLGTDFFLSLSCVFYLRTTFFFNEHFFLSTFCQDCTDDGRHGLSS